MRTAIPILFSMLLATAAQAQEYEVVLAHGRVLDPASDLDAVRYVGIRGAKIGAISETPLQGRTVVDASGLVVRSEEHTSELQSLRHLVCRLLLDKNNIVENIAGLHSPPAKAAIEPQATRVAAAGRQDYQFA